MTCLQLEMKLLICHFFFAHGVSCSSLYLLCDQQKAFRILLVHFLDSISQWRYLWYLMCQRRKKQTGLVCQSVFYLDQKERERMKAAWECGTFLQK